MQPSTACWASWSAMFAIRKSFEFSAAHQLYELPPDHPCSRLHGHNYTVELIFESDSVDTRGFVKDYRALDPFKRWLDANVDHRFLNEIMTAQTTAENMARWFYEVAIELFPNRNGCELVEVRVSETAKTWASFYPNP